MRWPKLSWKRREERLLEAKRKHPDLHLKVSNVAEEADRRTLVEWITTKVFEVIPPAVDTELNQEGRAKRGNFRVDLKREEFVVSVMKGLENDVFEIGYGMTEGSIRASRAELDKIFQQMNSRW